MTWPSRGGPRGPYPRAMVDCGSIRTDGLVMRTRTDAAWRRFLAIGAGVALVSAVLPVSLAALVGEVVGAVGLVVLLRGARRHHAPDLVPFRLLAGGASLFLVGNLLRAVQ